MQHIEVNENTELCPLCGASFLGASIPEEHRHYYGGKTHFSKLIGVEIRSIYDGVIIWCCPSCRAEFPRFS